MHFIQRGHLNVLCQRGYRSRPGCRIFLATVAHDRSCSKPDMSRPLVWIKHCKRHFAELFVSFALQYVVCFSHEYAIINTRPTTQQSDTEFQKFTHKTYRDLHSGQGFVGGERFYATNTNDSNGVLANSKCHDLPETESHLACYYIGLGEHFGLLSSITEFGKYMWLIGAIE